MDSGNPWTSGNGSLMQCWTCQPLACDGELVVKQQSLGSKLKGHINASLMCRFLYGVGDGDGTETLYCLDIRDDSMTSRVENALIYAHDQLKKSEKLK
jgi:hypothetical protein